MVIPLASFELFQPDIPFDTIPKPNIALCIGQLCIKAMRLRMADLAPCLLILYRKDERIELPDDF